MLKQNNLLIGVTLLLLVLLSGCSQSDGHSNSEVATTEEPVVINGHTLPPRPDPKINNSTLLGIDSNNNGVRDDVEIWIYQTYKDKHPIYIDIAMQAGRAYKLILEYPERALEIENDVGKPAFCQLYYQYSAKYYNEPLLVEEGFSTHYLREKIYFNTKERMDTYLQYDHLLSGGMYTLPSDTEKKKACDFNTSKYEK